MNVLVVGGGQVGDYLAGLLSARGDRVTVIEPRPERVEALRRHEGIEAIRASGTDADALERAGVRRAELLAAVTGDDAVNLAAAMLARLEFGVPRTVARVNDPHASWLFVPALGVDGAVNQADLVAHLIAETRPDAAPSAQ